jgi:tetratricopeptide (TPR) repeat protein
MKAAFQRLNPAVAAFLLVLAGIFATAGGARAGDAARLDALFGQLVSVDAAEASGVEADIWIEWSKSGSPSMDLLLTRGREAIERGDLDTAIGHLTALTDHAPDFAEGWNARATAYYQRGDLGLAVEDIAHTLTLEPRHFGALSGLALVYESLEKPEKALAIYNRVLTIHPHAEGVSDAIERLTADSLGTDL